MIDQNKILTDFALLQDGNVVQKLNNCAKSTVYRILKKNNIVMSMRHTKQKYKINEDFFQEIDTEEKAYWLGFLYADGYIHVRSHQVKLQLQNRDENHLNKYIISLNSNSPIKTRMRKDGTSFKEVSIHNVKLMTDVVKLGCTQAKTHTLTFPQFLKPPFIRHFIRGYFDGDGCITISNNTPIMNIVSNMDFLSVLQNIFVNEIGLNQTQLSIRHKDRINRIRTMSYGGINNVMRIAKYLYQDSTICLTRKKDKFISIFQNYINRSVSQPRCEKIKVNLLVFLNEMV